jgi:glycosyltransferase involved in cell wall biosynthesis
VNRDRPHATIIIPIYNEEAILHAAVVDLIDRLTRFDWSYELILAENGSTDRTVAIATELSKRFPQLRLLGIEAPNYGKALRRGILAAVGEYVFCDEIDLCDTDFCERAMQILEADQADFVVGSKLLAEAEDKRPLLRRAGSLVITGLLRAALGFRGTDTHGLKAFRRSRLVDIANRCVVDKDLFASEFVIRAEREGIRIREIPVTIREKRPPSINLFRRVPNVLMNLGRLIVAIRFRGNREPEQLEE